MKIYIKKTLVQKLLVWKHTSKKMEGKYCIASKLICKLSGVGKTFPEENHCVSIKQHINRFRTIENRSSGEKVVILSDLRNIGGKSERNLE